MVNSRSDLNQGLLQKRVLLLMAVAVLVFGTEENPPTCSGPGKGCFGEYCYQFVDQRLEWTEAKKQCTDQSSDLLSLHAENESEFVSLLLCSMNAATDLWTSGYARSYDPDSSIDEQFIWFVQDPELTKIDWMAPTDVAKDNLNGSKVTILLSADLGYQNWTITDFDQNLQAVCKWRLGKDDECPHRGLVFQGVPFFCPSIDDTTVTDSSTVTVTSATTSHSTSSCTISTATDPLDTIGTRSTLTSSTTEPVLTTTSDLQTSTSPTEPRTTTTSAPRSTSSSTESTATTTSDPETPWSSNESTVMTTTGPQTTSSSMESTATSSGTSSFELRSTLTSSTREPVLTTTSDLQTSTSPTEPRTTTTSAPRSTSSSTESTATTTSDPETSWSSTESTVMTTTGPQTTSSSMESTATSSGTETSSSSTEPTATTMSNPETSSSTSGLQTTLGSMETTVTTTSGPQTTSSSVEPTATTSVPQSSPSTTEPNATATSDSVTCSSSTATPTTHTNDSEGTATSDINGSTSSWYSEETLQTTATESTFNLNSSTSAPSTTLPVSGDTSDTTLDTTLESTHETTSLSSNTITTSRPTSSTPSTTITTSVQSSTGTEVISKSSSVTTSTTLTTDPNTSQSTTSTLECEGLDYGGCTWPDTPAGETAMTDCPNGTLGQATWYCDPITLDFWTSGSPDFSQCENSWVDQLDTETDSGGRSALELAESMWLNATKTPVFYSKDLSTLQDIMFRLNLMYVNETVDRPYGADQSSSYFQSTYNFTMFIMWTCNILVDANQSLAWDQLYHLKETVADQLTINVENVGFIFAFPLHNRSDSFKTAHIELYVERRSAEHYDEYGYHFVPDDTEMGNWKEASITLPAGFQEAVLGNMTSVVTILYSNMQGYLGNAFTDDSRPVEVITNILGISIGPVKERSVHFTTGRIQFQIPHTTPDNDHVHICSFWNATNECDGCWDAAGCTVDYQDSHITTCSCDHLTDFAVLLDINGILDETSLLSQEILNVLTILCGCLSIISLILCLIIFQFLRVLQSLRTSITKNLCVCLLIENVLMLTGLDRTGNKIVCAIIAATLQYVLLAAFMWMLLEGIHLYRLVIQVFDTCVKSRQWYYVTGYGVPLIIVLISAAIDPQGYGTDSYCWLETDDNLIWSFAGPVIVVILVNFCMLILALRTARRVKARQKRPMLAQFKKYMTGVFSLTSVLGLTWIFGFFYTEASSIVFAYIFTILNASQGVFIFVFQCIINDHVRKCVCDYLKRCTDTNFRQKQVRDPNSAANDGRTNAEPFYTIELDTPSQLPGVAPSTTEEVLSEYENYSCIH